MEEEGLEFPGERYEPPFNYIEIVARASGEKRPDVMNHLRDIERELKHAEVDVISLVADSELDDDADMKYSFHITFQGFTGYYSWTHQWIGFDAEGQDAYGQGLSNLMQLRIDPDDYESSFA